MVLRSQTITNSERRYINSKVLDLIEDFESYASMYDEDAVYYMGTLFESENSPVLCDMIGSPQYQTRIPVSEYMSLLTSQSLNTSIVIRDVKKGTMSYSDGKWRIPVTFNKDLAYIDKGGYLFSVSSYYLKEFTMTMNVIYDRDRDVCFIESIDGKLSSEKTFPKGRFLIIDESLQTKRGAITAAARTVSAPTRPTPSPPPSTIFSYPVPPRDVCGGLSASPPSIISPSPTTLPYGSTYSSDPSPSDVTHLRDIAFLLREQN